jgi:hypothetical protein
MKNKKKIMPTTWNYRFIVVDYDEKLNEDCIEVYRVYYQGKKIVSYTDNISPYGATVEEISNDLTMMLDAGKKPLMSLKSLQKQCHKNCQTIQGSKK